MTCATPGMHNTVFAVYIYETDIADNLGMIQDISPGLDA